MGRGTLSVIAAGLVTLLAPADPLNAAGGAEDQLRYVDGSASLEVGSKSRTLACPGDFRAIGGGLRLGGSPRSARARQSKPVQEPGATFRAWRLAAEGKTLERKEFEVFAICAPVSLGTAFTRSSVEMVPDNSGTGLNQACPRQTGNRVAGGGFDVSGDVLVNTATLFPFNHGPRGDDDRPDAWRLFARNRGETGSVQAWTMCIEAREPRIRYVRESRRSDAPKLRARAMCPPGTAVVGGGGAVPRQTGHFVVRSTHPVDGRADADSVPDDGWAVAFDNRNRRNRTLLVRAACLPL